MAQQLNPYITFAGNCAEAMDFYAQALGGSVQKMTFRDAGMDADGVMHAALETPAGFHVFASDTMEGMPYEPGNNLQVSISGDDAEALRGYWEALSDGGNVVMPLERQMWGDDYGMLADRFGVLWHVNISVAAG
ncbi:MAG: VOC family protein [Tetrasphaera sp.]